MVLTQRRKDAKKGEEILYELLFYSAPLRLYVKSFHNNSLMVLCHLWLIGCAHNYVDYEYSLEEPFLAS